MLSSSTCWYYFMDSRISLFKKFPGEFLLPFLMERLVGTKYLFSQEGRFALKLLMIWLIKWKGKNWLHADEFWSKIGNSMTSIGYFCVLLLCFCYYGFDFHSRFLLETKGSAIKLHCNRKGWDHIACEFPVYPRSKHGLSKNTLIFRTFATAINLHFLYF